MTAVVLAVIGVLVPTVLMPTPSSAAAKHVRYASPTAGNSTTCTKAKPCTLVRAVNEAALKDTVIIEPGRYGSAKHPITSVLQPGFPINIKGSIKHAPRIYSAAANGLNATSSRVRGVVIRYSGVGTGLTGNLMDHVAVYNDRPNGNACQLPSTTSATLVESLCAASGRSGAGLIIDGGSAAMPFTIHDALQGVTAVGRGVGGVGVYVLSGDEVQVVLNATNSIFDGKQADLVDDATEATAAIQTHTSHCRIKIEAVTDGPGSVKPPADQHAVRAAPRFANAKAGDYRERAGSPTVDAGRRVNDAKDLAGNKRTIGKHPDIGAYEYPGRHRAG